MPEMTAASAAEALKTIAIAHDPHTPHPELEYRQATALDWAAEMAGKIASGEYAPVVHARWIPDDSNPDNDPLIATAIDVQMSFRCSHCGDKIIGSKSKYCPNCGALMDGKDDSHE